MAVINLIRIQCCTCGIYFGLEEGHYERLKHQGTKLEFYCSNGHKQWFMEGEADKLRRERDKLKQQLAYKDDEIERQKSYRKAAENRVIAAKGQITKLKRRAKAGVCPCCNRTFSNMAQHMKTQHPGFDTKVADFETEKAKRA